MKISISVIIAITIALSILPYLWFIFIGKHTNYKHKKRIQSILKKEKLHLNKWEHWNNKFIGIDLSRKTLIYIIENEQGLSMNKIDLNSILSCQVKTNSERTIKKLTLELQKLDLELVLLPHNNNVLLNFYDLNDLFTEDFEMKRITDWQALIKAHITTIPTSPKLAA